MICKNTDCVFYNQETEECIIPEENNLFVNSSEHGFLCMNHITDIKDADSDSIKKYNIAIIIKRR